MLKKVAADLHCHSIASSHAYSTIGEYIAQAHKLGMVGVAVTDHGPQLQDSPHPWHFHNMKVLPDVIDGVRLIKGAETNVLNSSGAVDLETKILSQLDLVIASIHKVVVGDMTREEVNLAWEGVAKNPDIDMIGHCAQRAYMFDIPRVVAAFAENAKVVEINEHYLTSKYCEPKDWADIARECKRMNVRMAVTTDSHCVYTIGFAPTVFALIEELSIPEKLIINASADNLFNFLDEKGK